MVEHTPGQWRAEQGGIDGDEPMRWCVLTAFPDDPHTSFFVATVENGAPGDTLKTEAANARLIAAAPELLAACKAVCESLGIRRDFAPIGTLEFSSQLLTAIARAEGRTP